MAQYYGDEERSHTQLGDQVQEMSSCERDRADISEDGERESQAEGHNINNGEPENVTDEKEDVSGERNAGHAVEERDADAPSDRKVDELESGRDFPEGERCEDTGYEKSIERAPEKERAVGDGYEQSPYTPIESKDEFNKKAYGGEGGRKADGKAREEQSCELTPGETQPEQQADMAESGFSFPKHDGSQEGQLEGDNKKAHVKEKLLDTLVPCHKTQTSEEEKPHVEEAPKSPGLMEKMKEKLTGGKPHDATTPPADSEAADSPPKKTVFERVKAKLSPSSN